MRKNWLLIGVGLLTAVLAIGAIAALADERLAWMTGNVIGVDGGEEITA